MDKDEFERLKAMMEAACRQMKINQFRPLTSSEAGDARTEVLLEEAAEQAWADANRLTGHDEEPISRADRRRVYLQMAEKTFDRRYPE